jgi:4-aminobutyrate aminotransferase
MVGVEFVEDRLSKIPDPKMRDLMVKKCFLNGLLLLGCGENNIRFCPSLTVTEQEVDLCLSLFEDVLVGVT